MDSPKGPSFRGVRPNPKRSKVGAGGRHPPSPRGTTRFRKGGQRASPLNYLDHSGRFGQQHQRFPGGRGSFCSKFKRRQGRGEKCPPPHPCTPRHLPRTQPVLSAPWLSLQKERNLFYFSFSLPYAFLCSLNLLLYVLPGRGGTHLSSQ